MKKLVCLFAAITAMTATITSYAATYETSNNASTDKAVGMETVLIYKGSETPTIENIVYVDQASSPFTAATKFALKADAANNEGLYTVKFGKSDGTNQSDLFYIGMTEIPDTDTKMTFFGSETVADGITYNVGYKATASGKINSVIIKATENSKTVYMGVNLKTSIDTGGEAEIGIQIEGLPSVEYVEGIWLSARTITENADGTASISLPVD